MSPAEILRKAADLIEPDGKWCTGADAKTADGVGVLVIDPRAHSFDARNAVAAVCIKRPDAHLLLAAFSKAMQALVEEAGGKAIGDGVDLRKWNDSLDQSQVVAALRSAAEKSDVERRAAEMRGDR